MHIVQKITFLMVFFFPASGVYAYNSVNPTNTVRTGAALLRFAQAEIDALSGSDLRRLNFYVARAVDSLAGLTNETGSSSGSGVDQFRIDIQRLINAGARSGLSQDTTADYFQATAEQVFGNQTPLALQNTTGAPDARQLFSGVVFYFAEKDNQNTSENQSFVNQIENVDSNTGSQVSEQGSPEVPIAAPVELPTIAGPTIPDNANAATREVLARIQVRGDQWVIVSALGDSLSSIATAVYGDSLRFRDIYDNNQDVLTDPNLLEIDVELVLPQN